MRVDAQPGYRVMPTGNMVLPDYGQKIRALDDAVQYILSERPSLRSQESLPNGGGNAFLNNCDLSFHYFLRETQQPAQSPLFSLSAGSFHVEAHSFPFSSIEGELTFHEPSQRCLPLHPDIKERLDPLVRYFISVGVLHEHTLPTPSDNRSVARPYVELRPFGTHKVNVSQLLGLAYSASR